MGTNNNEQGTKGAEVTGGLEITQERTSNLPGPVLKQLEQANAALEKGATLDGKLPVETQPEKVETQEDPEAKTSFEAPDETIEKPQDQQPAGEVEENPDGEPDNVEQPTQEDSAWQHRFQVLQGKYNAEIKPLQTENSRLKTAVEQAELRVKELQNDLVRYKGSPGGKVLQLPKWSDLPDAERSKLDEMGFSEDDFSDVFTVVNGVFEQNLSQAAESAAKIDSFNSGVKSWFNEQGYSMDVFLSDPNLEMVMAYKDKYTGKSMRELLNDAEARNDIGSALSIYQDAVSLVDGMKVPAASEPTLQTPQKKSAHIAPKKAGAGSAVAAKKVTAEEYHNMAQRKVRGQVSQAEYDAFMQRVKTVGVEENTA